MWASPSSSSLGFCGRAAEFDALSDWYRTHKAEGSSLMLVSGVAGIGKTHLCSAFLAELAPEAVAVVGSTAPNPSEDNPFVSVTEALLETATRQSLVVPPSLLNNLSALRRPSESGPSTEVGQPFDASRFGDRPHHRGFVDLTQLVASQMPVVILIDDLQWVSPPAMHLLRHVLTNPKPHPVYVMATCRPNPAGAIGSFLSELELLGVSRIIELEGLAESEVAELLVMRGAESGDVATSAAKLTSLTYGNPLLIGIALEATSAQVRSSALADLPSLANSFAAFAPSTQRVLAQLGVFGRSQSLALLAEALDVDSIADDLQAASKAGWIEFLPNTQAASFVHDEFREAALRTQSADDLVVLHRAAARVLVDHADSESGLVFHLTEADADPAEVRELALTVARKSLKRQAFQEAAQLFALAMPEALVETTSAPAGSSEAESFDIVDGLVHDDLLDLAECLRRTNHPSAAHTVALAFESSRRRDDVNGMVRSVLFQTRIGDFSALGAVDETVVANLEYVLGRLDPVDRAADASLVLSALVEELLFGPIDQDRDAMSQRASALAVESGDEHAIFVSSLARRSTFCQPDQLDLRIKAGQDLAELTSQASNQWGLAHAHVLLAGNLLERGDRVGCETRLGLGAAANANLQSPTLAYAISVRRTALLVMDGNFDAALEAVAADIRLGELAAIDPTYTFGVYGSQMLLMNCSLGTTSDLIDGFKMGMETRPDFTPFAGACAIAMAEADHPDTADLVDALSADGFESVRFDYFWILSIAMIGRAALVIGRYDVCQTAFDLLRPFAGRLVWSGVSCSGPVDWYLGDFAAVLGQTAEARRYLDLAQRQADRLGMIPIGAHISDDVALVNAAESGTPIPGASFRYRRWPR